MGEYRLFSPANIAITAYFEADIIQYLKRHLKFAGKEDYTHNPREILKWKSKILNQIQVKKVSYLLTENDYDCNNIIPVFSFS